MWILPSDMPKWDSGYANPKNFACPRPEYSGGDNVSLNIRIDHITICWHKPIVNMADSALPV